jgi:endonuclease III
MDREILIQEEYVQEPWKMLVCCILLNQTNNKQVRQVLSSVFELIPDPISAIWCEPEVLAAVIKTTGFQNIKAKRIRDLSSKWVEGFNDPLDLPGIGQYGRDSWEIFIKCNLSINPNDKKLKYYLDSVRSTEGVESIDLCLI